jgi:hypothetical protein
MARQAIDRHAVWAEASISASIRLLLFRELQNRIDAVGELKDNLLNISPAIARLKMLLPTLPGKNLKS